MQILLDDPHMIARDGRMAFMSAIWFYMYPQSPKPSMHDAILGFFDTNAADSAAGICNGCFGTTTNIINGGLECGFSSSKAARRVRYFDEYCQAFGASCPQSGKSCDNQNNSFPWNSGGVETSWLIKDPDNPDTCMLYQWVSGYSVYSENDYKRCVCDNWHPDDPECLVVSDDCNGEESEEE